MVWNLINDDSRCVNCYKVRNQENISLLYCFLSWSIEHKFENIYTIAPDYTAEGGIAHKFLTTRTEIDATSGIKMNDVKGFEIGANMTVTLEIAVAAAEGTFSFTGMVNKIEVKVAKKHNGVKYKIVGEYNPVFHNVMFLIPTNNYCFSCFSK